jgi:transcriptional regulator with XRE-family HTH domain
MGIGDRLRECREKKGITQAELGKLINVSDATINRYERNFRTPDLGIIKKFSKLFNCTTDFLLGLTDNPETKIIPMPSEKDCKKAEIERALRTLVSHDDGEFPIEPGLIDTIYDEMFKAREFHSKRKGGGK